MPEICPCFLDILTLIAHVVDCCVAGKSLPVHCVVEAVCSVEPKLGAKLGLLGPKRPVVEADSYVIVPAATAFDDLVPVALAQLGYARDAAAAATGQYNSIIRQKSENTLQILIYLSVHSCAYLYIAVCKKVHKDFVYIKFLEKSSLCF